MHGEVVMTIRLVIEWASLMIEVLAVVIIVSSVIMAVISHGTVRFLFHVETPGAFAAYKHQLAKPLLLALDFLVAGDVVKTIALEPTLNNVAVLGFLVIIRTFLSWSITVEMEGHWPWQRVLDQKPPQREGALRV
jgi:uncharacterized membrane protein